MSAGSGLDWGLIPLGFRPCRSFYSPASDPRLNVAPLSPPYNVLMSDTTLSSVFPRPSSTPGRPTSTVSDIPSPRRYSNRHRHTTRPRSKAPTPLGLCSKLCAKPRPGPKPDRLTTTRISAVSHSSRHVRNTSRYSARTVQPNTTRRGDTARPVLFPTSARSSASRYKAVTCVTPFDVWKSPTDFSSHSAVCWSTTRNSKISRPMPRCMR